MWLRFLPKRLKAAFDTFERVRKNENKNYSHSIFRSMA